MVLKNRKSKNIALKSSWLLVMTSWQKVKKADKCIEKRPNMRGDL
jgi:hypothetical protein